MTFQSGNSLQPLRDVIDRFRVLTEPELQIALGEKPSVQLSPYVQSGNLSRARHALNHLPSEIMADFLADYLTARFGRAKASIIGRDIAQIAETRK